MLPSFPTPFPPVLFVLPIVDLLAAFYRLPSTLVSTPSPLKAKAENTTILGAPEQIGSRF